GRRRRGSEGGASGWARRNLFSSPSNTILTLVALYLLYLIIPPLVNWAIIDANWKAGTSRAACTLPGACWTMIRARFGLLMYGFYPLDQRWRADATFILQFATMAALLIEKGPYKKQFAIFPFIIYPVVAFILLFGGSAPPVLCGPP